MLSRTGWRYVASTLTRSLASSSSAPSPHPALTVLPGFLSTNDQQLLLAYSLNLLSAPSRTTAKARRLARQRRRVNPDYDPLQDGFMPEESYEFERGHFDGVITSYREMLVREGMSVGASAELVDVLQRCYALLPRSDVTSSNGVVSESADPPDHLIMHLLHLSGSEGRILPHVDNAEAFGQTIVGISLGSERVMKFKRTSTSNSASKEDVPVHQGPDEFQVLMKPGDAYIQREPLRTFFTHEIPLEAEHEGRRIVPAQRLSIMLRDKAIGGKSTEPSTEVRVESEQS